MTVNIQTTGVTQDQFRLLCEHVHAAYEAVAERMRHARAEYLYGPEDLPELAEEAAWEHVHAAVEFEPRIFDLGAAMGLTPDDSDLPVDGYHDDEDRLRDVVEDVLTDGVLDSLSMTRLIEDTCRGLYPERFPLTA